MATIDSVLLSCYKSSLLEASLCRREAVERGKTTRAGDDGKGKDSRSNCGGEIWKSGNVADNGLSGCLLSKVLIFFERRSIPNEPGGETRLPSVQRSMIIKNKQTNKQKLK